MFLSKDFPILSLINKIKIKIAYIQRENYWNKGRQFHAESRDPLLSLLPLHCLVATDSFQTLLKHSQSV